MASYNIQRRQNIGIKNQKIRVKRKRKYLCQLFILLQLKFKLWLDFIRQQDRKKYMLNKITYR